MDVRRTSACASRRPPRRPRAAVDVFVPVYKEPVDDRRPDGRRRGGLRGAEVRVWVLDDGNDDDDGAPSPRATASATSAATSTRAPRRATSTTRSS